jgi:hypothetical protein
VQGAALDARPGCELVRRPPARRGAEDGDVALTVGLGEDAERARLARAGDPGRHDDPVWALRCFSHELALLLAQELGVQEQRQERPLLRAGRAGVPALDRDLERLALEREQFAAREAGRPARNAWRERFDAREAGEGLGDVLDLGDARALR